MSNNFIGKAFAHVLSMTDEQRHELEVVSAEIEQVRYQLQEITNTLRWIEQRRRTLLQALNQLDLDEMEMGKKLQEKIVFLMA
jgi:hypothetical protein